MRKIDWLSDIIVPIIGVIPILQISSIYFFHDKTPIPLLRVLGWGILPIVTAFIIIPVHQLRKVGNVKKDKFDTSDLVDTGTYSVVRHPQLLAFVFIHISLILISQHIIVAVNAMISIMMIYLVSIELDRKLIDKFGDDYIQYMQRVPRMNLILGIERLLESKQKVS
jgi:protein-S-isoprenylcysteine O-methyltransferase Ste14